MCSPQDRKDIIGYTYIFLLDINVKFVGRIMNVSCVDIKATIGLLTWSDVFSFLNKVSDSTLGNV